MRGLDHRLQLAYAKQMGVQQVLPVAIELQKAGRGLLKLLEKGSFAHPSMLAMDKALRKGEELGL